MLQRAASNAYSWWWASRIRTTQSKWLDTNLQDMEERVKTILKLLGEDADSFAQRAEMYYKRRPEVISNVQEAYRAYRALVERYDHVSGELHKANHTIASNFPEQVQYAMLEEEEGDDFPKAITPIDSNKIHRPTVDSLMNKKNESRPASKAAGRRGATASKVSKEKAQEEINRLQKSILVLQDEFDTAVDIADDEARALMTATALKSCEYTIINLQKQHKESIRSARTESKRIHSAREKLKAIKSEICQSAMESVSSPDCIMGIIEEEDDFFVASEKIDVELIREELRRRFATNSESFVEEIAEKIDELVDKVVNLELAASTRTARLNRLHAENNGIEECLLELEVDMILISESQELFDKMKQAEEGLNGVETLEESARAEESVLRTDFIEALSLLTDISMEFQHPNVEETQLYNSEPQKVSNEGEIEEASGNNFIEEEKTAENEASEGQQISPVGSENTDQSDSVETAKKEDLTAEAEIIQEEEIAANGSSEGNQISPKCSENGSLMEVGQVSRCASDEIRAANEGELIQEEELAENESSAGDPIRPIYSKNVPSIEVVQLSGRGSDEIQATNEGELIQEEEIGASGSSGGDQVRPECSENESSMEIVQVSGCGSDEIWAANEGELIQEEEITENKLPEGDPISPRDPENSNSLRHQEIVGKEESEPEVTRFSSCGSHEIQALNRDKLTEEGSSQAGNQISHDLNLRDKEKQEDSTQSGEKEDMLNWQEVLLNGVERREKMLLDEYTTILHNYKETNRRLTELQTEHQEYILKTAATIQELSNANALKDEEIRTLQERLNSSDSNTADEVEESYRNHQTSQSISQTTNDPAGAIEPNYTDGTQTTSLVEEKFRQDIDALLEEIFQFLLRFAASFHCIQEFQSKYKELQAEMRRLEDDGAPPNQLLKPESAPTEKSLRALKTEVEVWLEQNALLRQELQLRFSYLCTTEEEITEVLRESSSTEATRLSTYRAAKLQGEVVHMQLVNNKIEKELQAGLDLVQDLHAKVEATLSKLHENFEVYGSENSYQQHFKHFPSRKRVPLRNFLFGAKPKKPPLFHCLNPVLQKQYSDLRDGFFS